MNKKETVKKFILDNPAMETADIAKICDTTYQYVVNNKVALRKEGKLSAYIPGSRRKDYIDRIKESNPALAAECDTVGIPIEKVNHGWYKGKFWSLHFKGEDKSLWDIKEEIVKEMKAYSPKYPVIKYPKQKEGHLLVIDPADIHIGKLCSYFESKDEYNHKIAVARVKSGVAGILQKAQSYSIDKILFVIGNDALHVDNAKNTTTSGTPQDTDIMWFDAFKVAQKLLIECIEMLLTVAPVHVQYDPSNHDYVTGFMLAQSVEAWFNKCKGITFNTSISHRKYFVYGQNLIGTTHGDGAKEADLPLLMAHESKDWNSCKHRYVYMHHIHHKKSKDYMSVCVEALRSPSGTDSWHHRNGYQHSPKAVEGFIHHKDFGQVARLTNLF